MLRHLRAHLHLCKAAPTVIGSYWETLKVLNVFCSTLNQDRPAVMHKVWRIMSHHAGRLPHRATALPGVKPVRKGARSQQKSQSKQGWGAHRRIC